MDVSEQIEQYAGRIFRRATPDRPPWVIDIVDDFSSLERHWGERRQWYVQHGAKVSTYTKWINEIPEIGFMTEVE